MAQEILFPDMVPIPGGSFLMGSEEGREDEILPHIVEISPFWIARSAVTNSEYGLFLRDTGGATPPAWEEPRFNHPGQPVVAVNWFEAAAYCGVSERTAASGATLRNPRSKLACPGPRRMLRPLLPNRKPFPSGGGVVKTLVSKY